MGLLLQVFIIFLLFFISYQQIHICLIFYFFIISLLLLSFRAALSVFHHVVNTVILSWKELRFLFCLKIIWSIYIWKKCNCVAHFIFNLLLLWVVSKIDRLSNFTFKLLILHISFENVYWMSLNLRFWILIDLGFSFRYILNVLTFYFYLWYFDSFILIIMHWYFFSKICYFILSLFICSLCFILE